MKIAYLKYFVLLGLLLRYNVPDIDAAYREQVHVIAAERAYLQQLYVTQDEVSQKQKIVEIARIHLYSALTARLFPFWYGTPWDFNGTTATPQKGKIACGYFVTTLLRDAGFELERVKLAQQSSEKIIRTLVSDEYVVRLNKLTMEDFVNAMRRMGNGLYLIGLDTHIGFLLVNGSNLQFIHSSYSYWGGVKSEPVWQCRVLVKSRFRVVGKLLSDEQTIAQWLSNKKFTTVL